MSIEEKHAQSELRWSGYVILFLISCIVVAAILL